MGGRGEELHNGNTYCRHQYYLAWIPEYLLGKKDRRCEITPQSQCLWNRIIPSKVLGVHIDERFASNIYSWGVEQIKSLVNNFRKLTETFIDASDV
jgi:hypothetical protein